jgi:PTS system cellobiose-specific IIA component
MDLENMIMELLVHAGSARSHAMMALQQARRGDFAAAEQAMAQSRQAVSQAHGMQTELIGMDEGCGKILVTLITVHAQDHLMNAMVIQDLAIDMIELYRRLPPAQVKPGAALQRHPL